MSRARRLRQASERSIPKQGKYIVTLVAKPQYPENFWITVCSVFAAMSFARTLWFGFVYDDHTQIVQNPQVQSWDYLGRLLVTELWSQRGAEHVGTYYRPLFSVWLLIVHTIGGLTPWIWHLSSLALHVAATFAVFKLSLALLDSHESAFIAGLLFAIHPIHVETVSWLSASNEILFSGFILFSFLFFVRAVKTKPKNSPVFLMSLLLWSAALLSKETAVALLPIFPLWMLSSMEEVTTVRDRLIRTAQACLPFVLTAVAYLGLRSLVIHRTGLEIDRHSWLEVAFTGLSLMPFYLRKLVFPVGLGPFYANPILSGPNSKVCIGALLILIGLALLVWLTIEHSRVAMIAAAFLLLPLAPVILGVRIFREGDLAHDRYLYLPSVGLCLLAGLVFKFLSSLSKSIRTTGAASVAVVCASFFALTISQQIYYLNDESFYRRALQVGPANTLVLGFLGDLYLGQGKSDLALEHFQKAYRISPGDPEVQFRLARGLFESKKYIEGEPYLSRLAHDPRVPSPRRALVSLSLAQTELRLGKLASAESVLSEMAPENDTLNGLHQTWGAVFEAEGKLAEAAHQYQRAFELTGDQRLQRRALELESITSRLKKSPQQPK